MILLYVLESLVISSRTNIFNILLIRGKIELFNNFLHLFVTIYFGVTLTTLSQPAALPCRLRAYCMIRQYDFVISRNNFDCICYNASAYTQQKVISLKLIRFYFCTICIKYNNLIFSLRSDPE